MGWFGRKDPPDNTAVPFRRADRQDVLDRLRHNVERRMRPVEPPRETGGRAQFVPVDFQTVDDVLYKARQDIRRGLIDPTAILILAYDQNRRQVIWYQHGRENDEADAAFQDWLQEVVFDE